ncbi:MAG: extracellular solute-binding protein [Roseibacillus sp.]|nr:extracellular solute-binding protein [Roseibacillus sp.]
MNSWKKILLIVVPLMVVVAAPLVLRDSGTEGSDQAVLRLDVITPHTETLRREFGEAFADYWQKKTGESVYVNFLVPGGTSECVRVIGNGFEAARERGVSGCNIDVFFGGGAYDFAIQAKLGRFEKLRIFDTHPQLFGKNGIPATLSGETFYDPDHAWIGSVLSSFGIAYNTDLLAERGLSPPVSWDDLGDPGYVRGIALADTTKSSSVTKSFEMLVQQKIQNELALSDPAEEHADVVARGWDASMHLIQRIGANARYFTDSSAKIPRDVAQGNAVAGMCIDFYGRTTSETLKKEDGSSRLQYIMPSGGSSISVDPVAVLKGAPHPELAQAFVEFVLSREGQMLWAAAPGSLPGPRYRALRRLPIRPDLYEGETLAAMIDGEALPFEQARKFSYDRKLTGHLFSPLRTIIRVMCIDPHDEMKAAWDALIEAGFPPQATARFHDVSAVAYDRAGGPIKSTLKKSKVEAVKLMNELGSFFRENYREARRLAEEGK